MNGLDVLGTALALLFLLCCWMAWEKDIRARRLEEEMRELRDQAAREARRGRQFAYYHGANLHGRRLRSRTPRDV